MEPSVRTTVTTVARYLLTGTGVPTVTAVDGAVFLRTDSPYGVYQMRGGSWVAV